MDLLLHLSFELTVDHNFLFRAHLGVEKFHCDVALTHLEAPNVLLFGRLDTLANFSDFEVLGDEASGRT